MSPHGAGSLTEVVKGQKYYLRVYLGKDPVTGNPRQRQKTFIGGQKAAGRALAEMVTEAQKAAAVTTASTVSDLLDAWVTHTEQTRRPSTILGVKRKINGVIRPALGDVSLRKLDARTLDAFYQAQLKRGVSTTTVRQYHAILSAALNQAEKWDWLDKNPIRRTSPPTARKVEMNVPTPAELQELVSSCQATNPTLAAAISIAALTGVRRGELSALKWSDVDLTAGTLNVARSLTVVAGTHHDRPTKTHQSRRMTLGDAALAAFQWQQIAQVDLSERAGSPLVADPYVLSFNANGAVPVSPDTLSHQFRSLCDGKFRFHDLRHFNATELVAAGIDIRTVSARLGHAQTSMTLDRYAHALPAGDVNAAGVINLGMDKTG